MNDLLWACSSTLTATAHRDSVFLSLGKEVWRVNCHHMKTAWLRGEQERALNSTCNKAAGSDATDIFLLCTVTLHYTPYYIKQNITPHLPLMSYSPFITIYISSAWMLLFNPASFFVISRLEIWWWLSHVVLCLCGHMTLRSMTLRSDTAAALLRSLAFRHVIRSPTHTSISG